MRTGGNTPSATLAGTYDPGPMAGVSDPISDTVHLDFSPSRRWSYVRSWAVGSRFQSNHTSELPLRPGHTSTTIPFQIRSAPITRRRRPSPLSSRTALDHSNSCRPFRQVGSLAILLGRQDHFPVCPLRRFLDSNLLPSPASSVESSFRLVRSGGFDYLRCIAVLHPLRTRLTQIGRRVATFAELQSPAPPTTQAHARQIFRLL